MVFWILYLLTPPATSVFSAGSILVALLYGCLTSTVGIDVAKGWRHLLVNIGGCLLVVFTWKFAAALL